MAHPDRNDYVEDANQYLNLAEFCVEVANQLSSG